MSIERKRPKLHCSECGEEIKLTRTRGMVGEGYFFCESCDAMFSSIALTTWLETGVEMGQRQVQDKIKDALGI